MECYSSIYLHYSIVPTHYGRTSLVRNFSESFLFSIRIYFVFKYVVSLSLWDIHRCFLFTDYF